MDRRGNSRNGRIESRELSMLELQSGEVLGMWGEIGGRKDVREPGYLLFESVVGSACADYMRKCETIECFREHCTTYIPEIYSEANVRRGID